MADARTFVGKVPEFQNGDDFIIYEEKFTEHCKASSISDSSLKVSILISTIGTNIYKTLRDLCLSETRSTKTFEQLCQLMRQHYNPQINVFRERINFYQAVQLADEQCTEYFARLKRQAINCKFTNIDRVLVDRFITGMRPGKILDRIVEESTMDAILKVAMAKETALANSSNGNNSIHSLEKKLGNQAKK